MIQPGQPPTESEVKKWIGNESYKYWKQLENLIEKKYTNIFSPEWLFGGKKHGWARRYKKSRSFCTFIPERNQFGLLIVFGAKEREKVKEIFSGISAYTRKLYSKAKTYHDGKWLFLTIKNEKVLEDVIKLLEVKRKPKKSSIE